MGDLLQTNYNIYSDVKYLNLRSNNPSDDYITDLTTNFNDGSGVELNDKINSMNSSIKTYLSNRNELDSDDSYIMDDHILNVIKKNNSLMAENLNNANELSKENVNRLQNLKNNKIYNSVLYRILEDGTTDVNGTMIDGYGKGEIHIKQNQINKMDENIMNKKRELEINTYYEKKYKHQIGIIKYVVIIILFLLLIAYIFKIGLINENVFVGCIGLGLGLCIIYIMYSIVDILFRDNINYDEYGYIDLLGKSPNVSDINKENKDLPLHLLPDLQMCDSSLNIVE